MMLLEEMLSRLSSELKNCGSFYLTTILKQKDQVWFSRQRMGEHKIEQITNDMTVKSGLTAVAAKTISNHSSRKTCVLLSHVTEHRNVLGLNSREGNMMTETNQKNSQI